MYVTSKLAKGFHWRLYEVRTRSVGMCKWVNGGAWRWRGPLRAAGLALNRPTNTGSFSVLICARFFRKIKNMSLGHSRDNIRHFLFVDRRFSLIVRLLLVIFVRFYWSHIERPEENNNMLKIITCYFSCTYPFLGWFKAIKLLEQRGSVAYHVVRANKANWVMILWYIWGRTLAIWYFKTMEISLRVKKMIP